MLKSIYWILLLYFSTCNCETDRFTGNVANFALESIQRIPYLNPSLLAATSAFLPNSPSGIFNIEGVLRDTVLSGLNSITNIATLVPSLTMSGSVHLEYGFVIQTPILNGQYDLSGFIGSSIPFSGVGNFQIHFVNPITISCSVEFSSSNGFLQLGNDCFLSSSQVNVTDAVLDFHGIVVYPLLDPQLKFNVLNFVVDYVNTFTLSRSITDAVVLYVNSHLNEDFQSTKLMDIILANKAILSDFSQNRQTLPQDNSFSSVVEGRLATFVERAIKSFIGSIDDPLQLGTMTSLYNYRNALFPSGGILSDLRLTGFRYLSTVECSSRVSHSSTDINIMIEMSNVTLLGNYNITGSITGETPVDATGEFSIQSEMGARFAFNPSLLNVNGHLAINRMYSQGFTFLSDTFGTSFPGLLDDVDLTAEIAKAIVDSTALSVVCPREAFCSHEFIREPLLRMFEEHLRHTFAV